MRTPSTELERTHVAAGDMIPGYEILSVIGTGGFGTVVQARQLKLDRVVALKVIEVAKLANPALAARFESEAITLAKFHHPNIVQVHDFAIHAGRMFIAMELLEGEDLGQRLKRAGRLDERMMWLIARQTASALAHAAGQGVVHRDIKPTNLFLIPAPTGIGLPRDVPMVKVTDFGLALTKWAADAGEMRLTAHGTVLGTPAYMAPEQYRRSDELDQRVDIYALGATIYHCLAGRPPFEGGTVWDVMVQKHEGPPREWPDIAADSIALLSAMLVPNPQERIGTYEQLVERIDQLAALREPDALRDPHKTTVMPEAAKPRPGRRLSYRLLCLAVMLLAALIGLHFGVPKATVASSDNVAPRFVSGGDQHALFDNESLAGWLPPAAGGAWHLEFDDEHTRVLSGSGFTRRAFPITDNFRVTIGLDLNKATSAEVHFGLRQASPDLSRRLVVRVSKSAGAVLGVKDGDLGAFRALGPASPFPPAEWFEGRQPYLEVRVQRAGGVWTAWFHGRELGRATDDGGPAAGELRLFAEGGTARVDSVVLERLQLAVAHQ